MHSKKVQSIISNNNKLCIDKNNSITDCVINFFISIIGRLDPVIKKLVTKNISNLQLQCKNAKFDVEIMDFIKSFWIP